MNATKIATLVVAAIATSSIVAAPARKDIVDTAVDSKHFPTLVSLVTRAGLVDTLKGKGPFTVFAPTEAAFKAVPKATLDSLLANNNAGLKKVLLYHVVPGNIMAKDAVAANGKSINTALEGGKIKVTVRNNKVMINNANVVRTDIQASNGVIHVIDRVIVPPAELLAAATPKPAPKSGCSTCDK